MSVLLFSGGRGNRTLLESISADEHAMFPKLQVVVNGLDDGASTGSIRELFDNGMHGISDFFKVGIAMSPNSQLKIALEKRLPVLNTIENQLNFAKNLHDFLLLQSDSFIFDEINLNNSTKKNIKNHILNFIDYFYKKNRFVVNLSDYKIGNIVFASMYINANFNFYKTLSIFLKFCQIDRNVFDILQSSEHNSYLVGVLKSGQLLPNEAAVVLTRTTDIIEDTFQINKPLSVENIRDICSKELEEKLNMLNRNQFIPPANSDLIKSINNAEALIYGAGTPYSSLLPSLELKGVADAIKNVKCKKILVVNLSKETSNTLFVTDILDSLMKYLLRSFSDPSSFTPEDFLTHIIVPFDNINNLLGEIKLDISEISKRYSWVEVIQSDVRDLNNSSQHDGEKLKNCLIKAMSNE